MGSLRFGLLLFDGIFLDSVEKLFPRSGMTDVLDPNIDSLFDVTVSHALVYDDPDCRLSHVVYDTGLAMVDFMRHPKGC